MGKAKVGLQLFSVFEEVRKDLAATLEAVGKLGYAGAEPFGFGGEELAWMGWQAKDLRRLFDDNGLVCCGIHLGTGALMGDNLQRTIEFNQILGNHYLIIAGDGKRMSAPDTIMELAGILNSAAEVLKPLDMYPGYHAHFDDFVMVGEETAWDRLFGNTVPEVVMQMDTGNCMHGGGDPVAILEKFPGRAKTIHLKDEGGETAIIGQGDVDWPTVFDVCDRLHHPKWYVVEEETNGGSGFKNVALSLQALKAMNRA